MYYITLDKPSRLITNQAIIQMKPLTPPLVHPVVSSTYQATRSGLTSQQVNMCFNDIPEGNTAPLPPRIVDDIAWVSQWLVLLWQPRPRMQILSPNSQVFYPRYMFGCNLNDHEICHDKIPGSKSNKLTNNTNNKLVLLFVNLKPIL